MWVCREELFSQEQNNLPVPSMTVLHCGIISHSHAASSTKAGCVISGTEANEGFCEGNPRESLTSKKSEEIWFFFSFILGIHGIRIWFLPHATCASVAFGTGCLSNLHYEQVSWPIEAAQSCLLRSEWGRRAELSAEEISDSHLALANKSRSHPSPLFTQLLLGRRQRKRAQTPQKEQNTSRRPRWSAWFMNGWMKHLCSSPHACLLLPVFVLFLK